MSGDIHIIGLWVTDQQLGVPRACQVLTRDSTFVLHNGEGLKKVNAVGKDKKKPHQESVTPATHVHIRMITDKREAKRECMRDM